MKEKTKKSKKETFISRLSRYTDISIRPSKGFRIEISSDKNRYKTIIVYDIKRIEKYTENCIILITEKENLIFSGTELECHTYANGAVEISGEINVFEFLKREGAENV